MFSELEGISSGYERNELEIVTRRRGSELRIPARRMPQTVTLKRG
jgi:hypothetical protein